MLQKPNTVFVGKKFLANGTATLTAGDIVVINSTTGALVDTTSAIASTIGSIQLGYVKADGTTISKTAPIAKKSVKNITPAGTSADGISGVYVAPAEATATIDFAAVPVVVGKRYVMRLIYRDIYEHPGQFTHTYEYIAKTSSATTLAAKFVELVNNHVGRRVNASLTGDKITLLAKSVTDNGFGTQGKEAITPYSQVMMRPVMYSSTPNSQFNSVKEEIVGITIANTQSKPGKGNAYIVRDREQAALGYKGITFRTTFPIIKPELNVDLTSHYDTLVIEFENKYQSPDNQYVKGTEEAAEIYIVNGATASAQTLGDKIRTWMAS
jgi:hypothetical protein